MLLSALFALSLSPAAPATEEIIAPRAIIISLCDDDPAVVELAGHLRYRLAEDGWQAERLPPLESETRRPCVPEVTTGGSGTELQPSGPPGPLPRDRWSADLDAGEIQNLAGELAELGGDIVLLLAPALIAGDAPRAYLLTGAPGETRVLRGIDLGGDPSRSTRLLVSTLVKPPPRAVAITEPGPDTHIARVSNVPDQLKDLWWLWAGLGVVAVGVGTGLAIHAVESRDPVQIGIHW